MKNKTLLDAWVASWKFHIVFYPMYIGATFDMMPKLFEPSNENPIGVQIAVTTLFVITGIFGFFRFAYIWYKKTKK